MPGNFDRSRIKFWPARKRRTEVEEAIVLMKIYEVFFMDKRETVPVPELKVEMWRFRMVCVRCTITRGWLFSDFLISQGGALPA